MVFCIRGLCTLVSVLIALACCTGAQQEGSVRLQDGRARASGTIHIFRDGKWGLVCDDGWNLENAIVVCRSLGYVNAITYTTKAHFGPSSIENIWLDDVQCYGYETSLDLCTHAAWGEHNCDIREAAGVYCLPHNRQPVNTNPPTTTITTTTRTTSTTSATTTMTKPATTTARTPPFVQPQLPDRIGNSDIQQTQTWGAQPMFYRVRLEGGRNVDEGRVEVEINGQWGVICSDYWSLLEANVVCRQLNRGYAKAATQINFFGGDSLSKLASGVKCQGREENLSECFHQHVGGDVNCPKANMIAGVLCVDVLPDLVPNATLLQQSAYLQDQPLYYLQCAMEENCTAANAYNIRRTNRDWHVHRRRLLRFSSSTWNYGTADFKPILRREDWEWHSCHLHYHSMDAFAHYDLLDERGNKVAEGLKASFCLEDVMCSEGARKKYVCQGYGEQGISIGCADAYYHDIDCQWIDITEVPPGEYTLKMHVNPENKVAELNFDNNAVICSISYNGYRVDVSNCKVGPG